VTGIGHATTFDQHVWPARRTWHHRYLYVNLRSPAMMTSRSDEFISILSILAAAGRSRG
jgi:hypothetical protein